MSACPSPAARIIVVEDDPLVRALFVRTLGADGFEAEGAGDAATCRALLRTRGADLVLVDLGLPDADGIDLARDLRAGGDLGLIVVSREPSPEHRVAALAAGCDDYIVKPAHLGELCARVRAVIRRRAPRRRLSIDVLTLDVEAHALSSGGVPIPVTRGEFTILRLLAAAEGAVVTRDALASAVSRNAEESDPRTVDALIRRIRRKLEAVTRREIVGTVPGLGYRLMVPVRAA